MTNPDSAMALATEINNYLNPLYNIGREQLAAIIRKHQAQEIGELVEGLRWSVGKLAHKTACMRLLPTEEWAQGKDNWVVDKCECGIAEAESLLSRYQKV